jgi:hypothetical protein
MKSYIKISGPPLLKAIKALEKVAIGMPEVCIWDTFIAYTPQVNSYEGVSGYFAEFGVAEMGKVSEKRCSTIISKSGESLGEYDFFFEWFKKPTVNELNNLIEQIDEALTPLGVRYTLTTK